VRTLSNRERTQLDDRFDELAERLTAARKAVGRAHDGSARVAPVEIDFAREHVEEIAELATYLDEYLARIGRSAVRPQPTRPKGGWIRPPHRPEPVAVADEPDRVAS
jgi:hypothetical protein